MRFSDFKDFFPTSNRKKQRRASKKDIFAANVNIHYLNYMDFIIEYAFLLIKYFAPLSPTSYHTHE